MPENTDLPCLELEPDAPATYSMILLHGGGGQNGDFLSLLEYFRTEPAAVRFILPNAPQIRITLFGDTPMRGWYDVRDMDLQHDEDETGIRRAESWLCALIERERLRGIPYHRIFIGGFSQGGAIALYAGIRHEHRLGGIIALSCYLPLMDTIDADRPSVSRDTPVYIGHGRDDGLVPVALAEKGALLIQSLGHPTYFGVFPTDHSTCASELQSLNAWLKDLASDRKGTA